MHSNKENSFSLNCNWFLLLLPTIVLDCVRRRATSYITNAKSWPGWRSREKSVPRVKTALSSTVSTGDPSGLPPVLDLLCPLYAPHLISTLKAFFFFFFLTFESLSFMPSPASLLPASPSASFVLKHLNLSVFLSNIQRLLLEKQLLYSGIKQ